MRYKLFAIVFLWIISINVCTAKWQRQNINAGISLSFPRSPIHLNDHAGERYLCQYGGCLFSVFILNGIIDDYDNFLLEPDSVREFRAMNVLESIAESKINQPFHFLISKRAFGSNINALRLEIVYATRQPSIPENNKQFSTLLLKGNTLYVFGVWYMDSEQHEKEKDKFFKSILVNDI